jgi:hypothetical protein
MSLINWHCLSNIPRVMPAPRRVAPEDRLRPESSALRSHRSCGGPSGWTPTVVGAPPLSVGSVAPIGGD